MSRPCFISDAQAREFERLVDYGRRCILSAGRDHARMAIEAVAGLSHDAGVLMRCAEADAAASIRQG